MPNKQARKQPKIPINARITNEANEYKNKYAILYPNLKKDTEIVEDVFLRAVPFFLEHSTSKPLEQPPSKASIPQMPENCKSCPLHGVLVQIKGQWKMICILKVENKQPNIEYHELVEAEICSTKPIYISKATQQEYEWRLEIKESELQRAIENEDILQRKDDYYEEIRKTSIQRDLDQKTLEAYEETLEKNLKAANRKLEPMQGLLTKIETLESEGKKMNNGLLARIEENNTLQTDNEYLRKQVEDLSHDSLVEKTKELSTQLEDAKQYVKVQEAQKNKEIGELNIDIRQLEALNEKENREKTEISSKIRSFLRDAKIPTYYEAEAKLLQGKPNAATDAIAFQVATYLGNIRKLIENFEGYLNTVAP
jgi:regulator of replication initiation timing